MRRTPRRRAPTNHKRTERYATVEGTPPRIVLMDVERWVLKRKKANGENRLNVHFLSR